METGGISHGVPSDADLHTLIGRTINKTKSLNARACHDRTLPSLAWIDVQPFDAMAGRGVAWHLPTLPSGNNPFDLRHAAVQLLQDASDLATMHGDMHLRNVLVRDGRDPFLIDYAYSGPGHPCFDLVRCESALLFSTFRMTDDERLVRDLLLAMPRDGATLASVSAEFPTLCCSRGNRLAIQASIDARAACMELLAQYGITPRHYHAMKLVVGCQCLTMPHMQTGVVRAAVSAAAHLFEQS